VYDTNEKKYLMICRSKSFGYIEFILGEYSLNNIKQIQCLIDEMSLGEKAKILDNEFQYLWNDVWYKKGVDEKSRKKFYSLKAGININGTIVTLKSLIDQSATNWSTPEWEFPKGRKNYQEKMLDCAIREFTEETGFTKGDIKIIDNIIPFEEIFIGSNIKVYKHKYYLALLTGSNIPKHKFQYSEIGEIEWKTYDECVNSIRHYSIEKINVIKNINMLISNYDIII
jgi:ADP-ribose pyrophosphatase YjhB (NUDIX family)